MREVGHGQAPLNSIAAAISSRIAGSSIVAASSIDRGQRSSSLIVVSDLLHRASKYLARSRLGQAVDEDGDFELRNR